MPLKFLALLGLLNTISLAAPVNARSLELSQANSPTSTPPKAEIQAACTNNQAQTLPNPFVDLSPDHWAFKAVMNLYYCGARGQKTPTVQDQG